MVLGITGNTTKDPIWQPVRKLIAMLIARGDTFALAPAVAAGLAERDTIKPGATAATGNPKYYEESDFVVSFGGDGTLLNTVHEVSHTNVPVLGVNMGRLGFLAHIDETMIEAAVNALATGRYRLDERNMLRVTATGPDQTSEHWGLNEVVITRSGVSGLLTIDVEVDGLFLNSYWADGLIVATPTGSTAYSLSAGGPIIVPGSTCLTITPLAPHSLTERPIVVPMRSEILVRVRRSHLPFVYAVDGRSTLVYDEATELRVSAGDRKVNLVRLPEHHYYETLRTKLRWGSGQGGGA